MSGVENWCVPNASGAMTCTSQGVGSAVNSSSPADYIQVPAAGVTVVFTDQSKVSRTWTSTSANLSLYCPKGIYTIVSVSSGTYQVGTGQPAPQSLASLSSASGTIGFGDASDGNVIFDGTTTVLGLAPSSSVYTLTRDILLASGVVNAGVTIKTAGFRIFCAGLLTTLATSVIHANGNAGGASSASTGGAAGAATATGSAGGIGAAGGAGSSGSGVGSAGSASAIGFPGATGGTGAGGGDGTHAGGAAGTFTALTAAKGAARQLEALKALGCFNSTGLTIFGGGAGGGGGAGDNADAGGGGGGGGGGICFVLAYALSHAGAITATGGAGSAGTSAAHNAGGGGGGDGGICVVLARTYSGAGTITAAGGAGGAKAGAAGVAGTAGSVGTVIQAAP